MNKDFLKQLLEELSRSGWRNLVICRKHDGFIALGIIGNHCNTLIAHGMSFTQSRKESTEPEAELYCTPDLTYALDPVVRRGDNFITGINHAIPRINFIPGLNCVGRSGDKFILGISRAKPGIKLTQRLSRVKSLSRCFFVMKHDRKQFCCYTCFSKNIPEQHQHFSFSHESQFLSQRKENITK